MPRQTPEALVRELQSMIEESSSPVALLDTDGRILLCNLGMQRLLELEKQDILGRHCFEVMHGLLDHIEGCPFKRMVKSLQRESEAFSIGGKRYDVVAEPVLGDDGELQAGIHIMAEAAER
jgi:PAS domain-containing protein